MAPQESFEVASFISGEKTPHPHPQKMEKNKFVYVFLSGKLADHDPLPSLLVENSTIFFLFLKPSLS